MTREELLKDFSLESVFVPFHLSRNAKEHTPSLNWKVTLLYEGRPVVQTDYMKGRGHCPSYKFGDNTTRTRDQVMLECRTGFAAEGWPPRKTSRRIPKPGLEEVMYALLLDARAVEYSFEDWAAEYGYDSDSRKAEALYRECQRVGYALRTCGVGLIESLHQAFEDY